MCESGILYEKCQIFNCHSLFCFLQHHMSWLFHFVRFWTQKGSCWSLQRGGRFYYKFRMGFVESGHMRELYIYMYILCENIFIPCSVNFSYLFCGILIQEIFFVLGRVPSKIIIEFDTYFFFNLGRLLPLCDKSMSSLVGAKSLDGLHLSQSNWSNTDKSSWQCLTPTRHR